MKTATQNLMSDHDNILQLIEVMYIMAEQKSTNTDDIATVITIIKNYADGFHHAKEENLLFPSMIEKGFSKEQGPIAVMLHDHSLGRQYVQGMNTGLEQYKSGDNNALDLVYENMCNYGQLLQSHSAQENNVQFFN
ncbi:MAG TPA: hemerythrin domain-containing protein [Bacteroidales bacterium]|nr:hemerythrin domain-containing protein [Bacteroidales bacterium]